MDKKQKKIESISLPFGSITLTQKFNLSNKIKPENEMNLKKFLYEIYSKVPWLNKLKDTTIICVGGATRNISKIDRKRKKYPIDITHNYKLSNKDINEI